MYMVGFHNFNLRIFNLRVSNPNKLIVDVFLTRCRISMCQGLGPKKHDEISEIDRTHHFEHKQNSSAQPASPGPSPHKEFTTVDFRNSIVFFWAETLAH